MRVILIDVDIEGHAMHVRKRMQAEPWRELTQGLDIVFRRFRDVDLDPATPDNEVWRFCQRNGYYLLTGNRNEDTEDSLQATIKREGSSVTLPVLTLPLADRVFESSEFLERVVEKLLDFMLYAENIRGAGRLYLP